MSDNIKAFPTPLRVSPDQYDTGMNLRDYFAIHAPEPNDRMTWDEVRDYLGLPKELDIQNFTAEMPLLYKAKKRYEYADAMLKAREL
jgi:hypothetical protein